MHVGMGAGMPVCVCIGIGVIIGVGVYDHSTEEYYSIILCKYFNLSEENY